MSGEKAPNDDEIREILRARPVIAMVGASSRPERPSHGVMRDLLDEGYDVIPVHPSERRVHGIAAYPDLRSIPRRVDLVDVFRRAEATPAHAREAVEIGARVLWLQLGIVNAEAARIAHEAGLLVIMDRCLMVEHHRLIGAPLGPERPPVADPAPRGPRSGPAGGDPIGLCRGCLHARTVETPRSTFWMCRRAASDPDFPKYPRLPVAECSGFEPATAGPRSGPSA